MGIGCRTIGIKVVYKKEIVHFWAQLCGNPNKYNKIKEMDKNKTIVAEMIGLVIAAVMVEKRSRKIRN